MGPDTILDDLIDEHEALDELVRDLDEAGWAMSTASPGWDITDQIGHLAFFDATATLALQDPVAFAAARDDLARHGHDGTVDEFTLGAFRSLTPAERLQRWRTGRAALAAAAEAADRDARVEWYGPSMGWRSFLTARLMETWAHGQDVADALDQSRQPTNRLRHIAQLGVLTRSWSYVNRGLTPPDGDVAVVLTGPDGDVWTWGDPEAADRVEGAAADFCLVVTQRRNVDDTALVTTGPASRDWMEQAQAFAGRPTQKAPVTR